MESYFPRPNPYRRKFLGLTKPPHEFHVMHASPKIQEGETLTILSNLPFVPGENPLGADNQHRFTVRYSLKNIYLIGYSRFTGFDRLL